MSVLIGSVQLGLLYGLLALGVYISFRILNIPDLTADGSFTLGLAVSAAMAITGRPYLGLAVALLAGMAAGAVTGLLQTKVGIHPILAGILTMSGLYTVNLFIMGASANVSLIGKETLFSAAKAAFSFLDKNIVYMIVSLIVAAAILAVAAWFFSTHIGLCIRATGSNEAMVRASSINVDLMKIVALAVSNGMTALSGAMIAQYQGFADISSGVGMVVVGLASVIIGEAIFGKRGVFIGLVSAVAGALVYRFAIALALKSDLLPAYALKLVSACIVTVALAIPTIQSAVSRAKVRREGMRHA